MLRICSGVKPRRLRPSVLTLCAPAGWPTAITNGGTSSVTAALFAMNACVANLAELVYTRNPPRIAQSPSSHVAGERRVVRKNAVAADHAVVRDVRVGHEQVVVADRA